MNRLLESGRLLMGRLLDPDGRAAGFVPMNLWA